MGGYEQSIIDFPESESNSQSNVENIDTIRYNPENVSEGEEMEIKEKDVKPLLKVSRALKTSKLRGNIPGYENIPFASIPFIARAKDCNLTTSQIKTLMDKYGIQDGEFHGAKLWGIQIEVANQLPLKSFELEPPPPPDMQEYLEPIDTIIPKGRRVKAEDFMHTTGGDESAYAYFLRKQREEQRRDKL